MTDWSVAEDSPYRPAGADTFSDRWVVDDAPKAAPQKPPPNLRQEIFNVFSNINERYLAPALGLPVDAANAALRAVGAPTSEEPLGGSESIKRAMRAVGASRPDAQPETLPGKIASSALGVGASSVLGGGMLGGAARGVGQAVGSKALTEAGKQVAAVSPNAIGGVAAGVGGEAAAEDFRGSPGEGIARVGGELLGGAASGLIPGVAMSRAVTKPDAVLSAYERLGLAPSAAEANIGGKTVQWLEGNVLPQTIGGGGVMEGFKQRRLQEMTNIQNRIAEAFGSHAKREEAGGRIQKSVMDTWLEAKGAAGETIGRIRDKYADDLVEADDFIAAAANPIGAAGTKNVRDETLDPLVLKAQELIRNSGGLLTMSDLAALKQMYGTALEPGFMKNVNDAQVNQLYNALRTDMERHVKARSPEDFAELQAANKAYGDAMSVFKQNFKKLIGTKEIPVSSERAYDIIARSTSEKGGGDMKEFRTVWDALPADEKGNLAATVVARMGSKDKSAPATPENFSLGAFLREYRDISDDAKNLLFASNREARRELDDLVKVASNIEERLTKLASSSRSGAGAIMYGQLGVSLLDPWALLYSIGGPWVAANVFTNPAGMKALSKSLNGLGSALDGMERNIAAYQAAQGAITAAAPERKSSTGDAR